MADAIRASNLTLRAGAFEQQDREFVVDAGTFVRDAQELEDLVIAAVGRPARVPEGRRQRDRRPRPRSTAIAGSASARRPKTRRIAKDDRPVGAAIETDRAGLFPAVHIAVAKRKGSNAVQVAEAVERRMDELAATHLPDGVYYRITRDYGETANHKVNELVESLVIAVLTVIGLIGVMIGWRAALVVTLAIPVCYSVTLFVNLLAGYTINRVTLFALILSLGLLVDDPITDVENIARYFAMRILPPREMRCCARSRRCGRR